MANFLKTTLFIILICAGLYFINYFFTEWDNINIREQNKKRAEFCRSFLNENSILYDKCLDATDEFNF